MHHMHLHTTSDWPTSKRWMTDAGASFYTKLVREHGYTSYKFDTIGQKDIITACNSHGPTDFHAVQDAIITSAAKRGTNHTNALNLSTQYNERRIREIKGQPVRPVLQDMKPEVREDKVKELEAPLPGNVGDAAARHALLVRSLQQIV